MSVPALVYEQECQVFRGAVSICQMIGKGSIEDVAFELCPDVMVRFKGQDRITEVLNVLLQSWDWICR